MIGQPTFYKVSRKKELKCYEVTLNEMPFLVRAGFGDDPDLLEKYQEIEGDFDTMVGRNLSRILEYHTSAPLIFIELRYGNLPIGFTAVDIQNNILYSFGINGKYRRASVVLAWLEEMKSIFDNFFYCVLPDKNSRAINFLIRNGMKIIKQERNISYLQYGQEGMVVESDGEVSIHDRLDELELAMQNYPPVNCPLNHMFTPGLYVREIFMPAGTLITSRIHNTRHRYEISKGRVKVKIKEGDWEELKAPHWGITEPGTRRVLIIEEDCVWRTYHPTDVVPDNDSEEATLRAVDKVEEVIIEKHVNKLIGGELKNNKIVNRIQ